MELVRLANSFWFIENRLIVPNIKNICESLFRLAHDAMGHFRSDKCIDSLQKSFYWPNMHCNLENAYIPSCADCQRNKSSTTRPVGPLHPLPIPDACCNSVAIDFIGPLPINNGYNKIITFTNHLGSDIQSVPSISSLTAEQLAEIFFDKWYCKNSLPRNIFSDHDKLFMSQFWKRLHELTSVKLKMSTSYHLQTDGSSEHTNKTIIQCICYAVEHDQLGWVKASPKIRFDIMNSTNRLTGFTVFQLHFGRSPCMLPPLFPKSTKTLADVIAKIF